MNLWETSSSFTEELILAEERTSDETKRHIVETRRRAERKKLTKQGKSTETDDEEDENDDEGKLTESFGKQRHIVNVNVFVKKGTKKKGNSDRTARIMKVQKYLQVIVDSLDGNQAFFLNNNQKDI